MQARQDIEHVQIGPAFSQKAILSLRGIGKSYGSIRALSDVSLDLRRGEIHAVLGENGAGKSTLIKIITGIIEKTTGEIFANGKPVDIGTPRNASRLGITLVPQDVLLVPELPVGRNILLGLEGRALITRGALSGEEYSRVRDALALVGANFAPNAPTRELAIPQQRLAQIARSLIQDGDIVVLDEPTAVLSEPDADHLLGRLEYLRDRGKSIVYITHRLSEVLRIADRATVLRDGLKVGELARSEFERSRFVEMMAKAIIPAGAVTTSPSRTVPLGRAVLSVDNLACGSRFDAVSFSAAAGQIVGIAGVQGSGHGHVLRTIAGVDRYTEGRIKLGDRSVRPGAVSDTFNAGLRLIPSDRRGEGVIATLSNSDNIALSPSSRTKAVAGFRSLQKERALAQQHAQALSIHPLSTDILTGNLSGGNQQKIVLARALCDDLKVLLAEEPTQGIDVRSRAEIHQLLVRLARDQGCAVVIASSEFDELIGLADTIHVMRLGKLVATLPGQSATYVDILHNALP